MEPVRDRLIGCMASALQRRGLHGVGLNELLAEAKVTKGGLYHHFPGGKTELALVAIESIVNRNCQSLEKYLSRGAPLPALRMWLDGALAHLEKSAYERGCPLATVSLETTSQDSELRQSLNAAFERLRGCVADALTRNGEAPDQARRIAALIISTYEGALMQARVSGSDGPMREATHLLLDLLEARQHRPASAGSKGA